MNGKVIITGAVGLSAIGGCVYLFIRNRKLKSRNLKLERACNILDACATVTVNELSHKVSEEKEAKKKK